MFTVKYNTYTYTCIWRTGLPFPPSCPYFSPFFSACLCMCRDRLRRMCYAFEFIVRSHPVRCSDFRGDKGGRARLPHILRSQADPSLVRRAPPLRGLFDPPLPLLRTRRAPRRSSKPFLIICLSISFTYRIAS